MIVATMHLSLSHKEANKLTLNKTMLNQENQVKVEQSTDDSQRPIQPATTAITNPTTNDSTNCKSEGQPPLQSNKHNPLLKDHDYCSPNKNTCLVNLKDKMKQDPTSLIDQPTASHDTQSSQATTLTASECSPSTSSSPSKLKFSSHTKNKNSNGQSIMGKFDDHVDDGNLSDSSSSSSLSDDDSDALVIGDPRPKSLAPKDTPSVSRPRPRGRPPAKAGTKQAARRQRQTTSVTDKSQWITGEEQIDSAISEHLSTHSREKRQRKEVRNPDFSHFTSSDYSSSDADSDESGEEDDDENDPNKPWCICMKPHGDQFMICCDICAYWYHGMCVGVTDQMSKRFEKEKKEWFCGECLTHLQNGTPRNAIPLKIVKKEKKTRKSGKRKMRSRKSDVATRESSRLSSRLAAKKSAPPDTRLSTRRSSNKYDAARKESFELFGDEQRLKGLIRERKQAFFIKRQLAERERLAKMKELGMTSHPLTGTLGNSLDSLASTTSSPNMSNLPMNIKPEYKERTKHNIVLQINTKKDGEVTAVVKSKKRKQSESSEQAVDDLFTTDPIQVSKKSKSESEQQLPNKTSSSTSGDRHGSDGTKVEKNSTSETNQQQSLSTQKKKRKDSESSTTSFGSKDIARKIKDCLEVRSRQLKNFEVPSPGNIEKLANEIETQMNECFKEGSQKYLNKYRSLIFNFTKNQELVKNVLSGEIQPSRLVRMSSDEMAPSELAKWRERHSKHEIELIKHNAQLEAQQIIVKKTHKGEEVINAPALNDPDDPTADVSNHEPPTTPTKARDAKDSVAKESLPVSKQLETTDTSAVSKTVKISIQLPPRKEPRKLSISLVEASSSIDTTREHGKHVFDLNCKTCTKQKSGKTERGKEEGESQISVANESEIANSSHNQNMVQTSEPKRFRVSIETSLDLASMSRLRDQPLIKPSERPLDTGEYSPSKVTPGAESDDDIAREDEEDEDLYDPETMLPASINDHERPTFSSPPTSDVPWSGSIAMADVGKFSASTTPVSGDSSFMFEEIGQNLIVCGRIRPEQVSSYVKQIKSTTKNPIISIQFHPKTDEDKVVYDKLFDYLYTRNRFGVIDNKAHSQIFRDFYIIPVHEGGNIPEVSKPVQGPGLGKNHPNCLLGLIVKTKRPTSASGQPTSSSSANYLI